MSSAEAADVDVEAGERAHQRLGLVGGERAAVGRASAPSASRTVGVGEQLARDPARRRRWRRRATRARPSSGGPALDAGPRRRRRRAASVPGQAQRQRPRRPRRGVGGHVDLGLEHLGLGSPTGPRSVSRASARRSKRVRNSRKSKSRRTSSRSRRAVQARSSIDRSSGHVADEHHHLGVLADVGLVRGQVLAQLRRLLVEVLEDAVEAAVGGDELGRGLLPHPGHAGQVVGRVAAQRGVLRVQRGRDAGALERCRPRRRGRSRDTPRLL